MDNAINQSLQRKQAEAEAERKATVLLEQQQKAKQEEILRD